MRLVLMSLFIFIGYLYGNPSLTYLDDMQDEDLYYGTSNKFGIKDILNILIFASVIIYGLYRFYKNWKQQNKIKNIFQFLKYSIVIVVTFIAEVLWEVKYILLILGLLALVKMS